MCEARELNYDQRDTWEKVIVSLCTLSRGRNEREEDFLRRRDELLRKRDSLRMSDPDLMEEMCYAQHRKFSEK